jgi:UBX domain-containing protein 1
LYNRHTDEINKEKGANVFVGKAKKLTDEPGVDDEQPVGRSSSPQQQRQVITRVLIFWADGFSFDGDTAVRSLEDPRNARLLHVIQSGRAPLHELGLKPDEEVEMKVAHLLEEEWSAERQLEITKTVKGEDEGKGKEKVKAFTGTGNRLGDMPSTSKTEMPSVKPAMQSQQPNSVGFNPTLPVTKLQLRLADGSKHTVLFNTSQTVFDVFATVASMAGTSELELLSGRPPVPLDSSSTQSLADAGLLASVIIQKP